MPTPSISIALATYNGEKFLPELLSSLEAQELPPDEVVVSDDGSTDNTLELLKSFQSRAAFKVKIVQNQSNLGIIENFATAFAHCSGDLIAYCDQDDVWVSNKLAIMHPYFNDPRVKLVMHTSEVVDEHLEPVGYSIPFEGTVERGRFQFPTSHDITYGLGHQMLFDASLYREYNWMFRSGLDALKDIAANYDTQFCFLAGLCGDTIALEDRLVCFRRHGSATSDAGLESVDAASQHGFLSKPVDAYARQARDFVAIADTLERDIMPRMPGQSSSLREYCRFLARRAHFLEVRNLIYVDTHFLKRLGAFFALCRHGCYRRKLNAGFGRRALLVDAVVALLGIERTKALVRFRSRL